MIGLFADFLNVSSTKKLLFAPGVLQDATTWQESANLNWRNQWVHVKTSIKQ